MGSEMIRHPSNYPVFRHADGRLYRLRPGTQLPDGAALLAYDAADEPKWWALPRWPDEARGYREEEPRGKA